MSLLLLFQPCVQQPIPPPPSTITAGITKATGIAGIQMGRASRRPRNLSPYFGVTRVKEKSFELSTSSIDPDILEALLAIGDFSEEELIGIEVLL